MHLLHPNASDTAPTRLVFFEPGAGTHAHAPRAPRAFPGVSLPNSSVSPGEHRPLSSKQVSLKDGVRVEERLFHHKKSAPLASDVLRIWMRYWLGSAFAEKSILKECVETLHAFEKQEGAPFTFKLDDDDRRWSIHGYLWARGASSSEQVSHDLSKAGYPPCSYGYSLLKSNAQGVTAPHIEPLGVCVLQRLNTLLKEGPFRLFPAAHELSPDTPLHLATCVTRLAESGYVLDFTSPTSDGHPLYQTALSAMHLRNVFPFFMWLKEQGVPLQGTPALLETLQARLKVGEESKQPWLGKKEEMMASVTALINYVEQHVLYETLHEQEESALLRPSVRTRL